MCVRKPKVKEINIFLAENNIRKPYTDTVHSCKDVD